jgi:hypothetical protein
MATVLSSEVGKKLEKCQKSFKGWGKGCGNVAMLEYAVMTEPEAEKKKGTSPEVPEINNKNQETNNRLIFINLIIRLEANHYL